MKPTNATNGTKPTHCSTGGTAAAATCTGNGPKADGSKRYGNGKTAAQIAVGRGAPAGTMLTGPGNSQPHKVAVCPKKNNKSGGVDVHAVKSFTASCAASSAPAQSATPPQSSQTSNTTVTTALSSVIASAASSPAASGSVAGSVSQGSAPGAQASKSQAPTSGVLGATATRTSKGSHPQGGVLGALGAVGGAVNGNLPFTGLPLWIVVAIGLGLVGLGLAVRRRGRPTA